MLLKRLIFAINCCAFLSFGVFAHHEPYDTIDYNGFSYQTNSVDTYADGTENGIYQYYIEYCGLSDLTFEFYSGDDQFTAVLEGDTVYESNEPESFITLSEDLFLENQTSYLWLIGSVDTVGYYRIRMNPPVHIDSLEMMFEGYDGFGDDKATFTTCIEDPAYNETWFQLMYYQGGVGTYLAYDADPYVLKLNGEIREGRGIPKAELTHGDVISVHMSTDQINRASCFSTTPQAAEIVASTVVDDSECDPLLAVESRPSLVVSIYPNPASEHVYIDGVVSGTYQLISSSSQVVKSGRVASEKQSISTKSLETGVYQLRLVSGEEVISQRIIIQ